MDMAELDVLIYIGRMLFNLNENDIVIMCYVYGIELTSV